MPIITANCCFFKAPKLPLTEPKLPLTVSKLPLTLMAINVNGNLETVNGNLGPANGNLGALKTAFCCYYWHIALFCLLPKTAICSFFYYQFPLTDERVGNNASRPDVGGL